MPEQDQRATQPPNDKEAEKGVLGSLLRDNHLVADVVRKLRAEDFYHFAHQKIFEGLTELCNQGKPADPVTLADFLNEKQLIADIGGHAYLVDLWDSAPTLGNAEHYADIIRQKSIVRNLIHSCTEIQKDALDQSLPAEELLGSAERRILEIAELGVRDHTRTLQQAIEEAYDRLDARKRHGASSGIATGYIDLDNLTAGLQNDELVVLAARPSVGKTSFALNVIRHVIVEEARSVLFVSLEQSRIEIAERLLCCHARVDSHKVRKGNLSADDMDKLISAGEVLSQSKLFIDDTPGQNMLRIAANARRLKHRHDVGLVVIDYLQLIDPDSRRDSRQEQVAAISRRLKFLARELHIPVVALAQVNRSSEDRQDHRPRLSDLRESGAIEQDADTVMMLHRPELHEPGQHEGIIEVIVAKQRNGPTGEATLTFIKQYMRFENHAVDMPPQFS
jgi:replicative DNA helicase